MCAGSSAPLTATTRSSAPLPMNAPALAEPSASTSPKPSRLRVFSSMAIMASAFPHPSSIPPVSADVISPSSKQLIAKAIAAGATMAFAINCFEDGLITSADTGGIELGWGKAEAMIAMLEKTLRREGFGDVLAEGSARAGAFIGNGAEDLVVAVKGAELPAHMPQVKPSLALIYAVNPFGADHQSSEHDPNYTPGTIEGSPDKYAKRMADIGLTDPQPQDSLSLI